MTVLRSCLSDCSALAWPPEGKEDRNMLRKRCVEYLVIPTTREQKYPQAVCTEKLLDLLHAVIIPKQLKIKKKKSELEQNKSVVGLIKNKLSIVSTMPIKSLPQQHPYKVLFPTVTSAVLNSYGKTTGSKPVTSKTLNVCCFFFL